ncbi:klu-1, partial [Pristionchus pacificus]
MLRLAEILEEEAPKATRRRRSQFVGRQTRSEEDALPCHPPAPSHHPSSSRRAVSFEGVVVVEGAATAAASAADSAAAAARRAAFRLRRPAKVDDDCPSSSSSSGVSSLSSTSMDGMDFLAVAHAAQRQADAAAALHLPSSSTSSPPLKPPPTLVLPPSTVVPPSITVPTVTMEGMGERRSSTFKDPPMICEQGPSAPSSPTSPGGTRIKRPSPIIVSDDASYRINLMSGSSGFPDISKMSLLSPGGYATSDLGSSPRSSFSVPQGSQSPLLLGPWTAFRDSRQLDDDGSGSEYGGGNKDLLSPGMMLSPAPFSPFSDYRSDCDTPYSSYARSPNLSPHLPLGGLHFSFDPVRSASSMSHRAGTAALAGSASSLLVPLDATARERSRSDSEMCGPRSDEQEERMDTSCVSVPVAATKRSGAYKKRLLEKYEQEQRRPAKQRSTSSPPPGSGGEESEVDDFDMRSISRRCSRQPTLDEMRPLQLALGIQEKLGQQSQIDQWMGQQLQQLQQLYRSHEILNAAASQVAAAQQAAILAAAAAASQPPSSPHSQRGLMMRQTTIDSGSVLPPPALTGPMKTATLWRRSRSESDVSSHHSHHQQFVCEHCGQAFALHDRLAKHIASRHRDKTPSQNEESKTHRCGQCGKSFGRSDMLTRHMRLHTGHKPYACNLCGQVFSRSDHLSTHQRTHTGEKPYQCPLCNYAASRRDMITRHMRTHIKPDGTPLDVTTAQLQQISMICGLNPQQTDMNTLIAVIGSDSGDGSQPPMIVQAPLPPPEPAPPIVGSVGSAFTAFKPKQQPLQQLQP